MHRPSRGRFEYDRAELWADGVIHGFGILLGLGAIGVLVASMPPAPSPSDLIPILVYGVALLTVLVISAIYNMWPISPVKWCLRRFDHAAIYVLIAGTYTPFLTRLSDGLMTKAHLGLVWVACLVGIVLKIALPGRLDRLSIGLYLLIGWSGVMLWDRVLLLPSTSLWLLGAGGLVYTAGVVFYVWERLRFQNAIWHACVLVAAACHYGAVFHAAVMAPSAWRAGLQVPSGPTWAYLYGQGAGLMQKSATLTGVVVREDPSYGGTTGLATWTPSTTF